MRWRARMNEPLHRLDARYARAYEDRGDDREASTTLSQIRTKRERDPERDSGQRIAEVVDQIGEQSNAATRHENRRLHDGGQSKHRKREQDRPDALSGTLDAVIHQPMRVPVGVVVVGMRPRKRSDRLRAPERGQVSVRTAIRMTMHTPTVAVRQLVNMLAIHPRKPTLG